MAPAHEVKHFHDALLCRPLFELFLLRNKVGWYLLQLAGEFRGLAMKHVPLKMDAENRELLTDRGTLLLSAIRREMSAFKQRYEHTFVRIHYRDVVLTLTHLLETSAIVLELAHVLSVHGEAGAENYYRDIVLLLPPEYSSLVHLFVERRGTLTAALDELYILLAYSLYCSDSPVETFAKILEHTGGDVPNSLSNACRGELTSIPFGEAEARLKSRIEKLHFAASDDSDVSWLSEDKILGPMVGFSKTIYACRAQLQRKYIGEFELALDRYRERFDELPSPPVLFYPIESAGKVETVSERRLREMVPEVYIIRAQPREDEDGAVLAALTSKRYSTAAIPLKEADTHLALLFFYSVLFEKPGTVYSNTIDDVYMAIFKDLFLSGSRQT
jgi:hypothetical protein